MPNTEKVQLDDRFGKEYAGEYIFGEITWARRSRILQKYTKYNKALGEVEDCDFIAVQAETILASLRKQPEGKPITLQRLLDEESGIPIDLGELFSQIVNRLNNLGPEEARFLSERSEGKNQTKPLQTSDSSKSSDGHRDNSQGSQQKPSNNAS
jgi:hypothetical protein